MGNTEAVPSRWYVVSCDGRATLCADENDARYVEDECNRLYPRWSPHRAVLLGDVAAERERLCAAIKAADDKASEGDYMLDSDDCISVIRGTWNPGA